ncbi:hypothetical protein R75471_01674 [Paraburkholderia domus]|uniref:ATP-binding protein n=1 Tax=Paraburkholderia domus TaxID=2793075 RepID=UPI001B0A5F1E|nr:ATP-binding protein [Paraburkholderia domus]CAE6879024.1 hypothetical protein R75471_01674 [Paraburkholderia domus]
MSEVEVNLSLLAPAPKRIEEDVLVGKDILDLLAGSMYVDPLNVYREYVQNSADSIDEARAEGIEFRPRVDIAFDHADRTVRIRDNGISIPTKDFVKRLVTVGASQKRGKRLRGFRGVGRLSGLGFCQELYFRGRAEGDKKVTEIRWDGKALKQLIRQPDFHGGLQDIVSEVVTVRRLPIDGYPERFFEVELRKVLRLKNDLLLNEEAVRHYLAQVAPVPSHEHFPFASELSDSLSKFGISPPVDIFMPGDETPIRRLLGRSVSDKPDFSDDLSDMELLELRGVDGEVAAVGWIANHSYSGALAKQSGLGGLRLRSGNIQVGDADLAADLFPESRFCSWTVGEIHVISPKILPNGRRDDFEPSVHYAHLQGEIALLAKRVVQKIRDNSVNRNRKKAVQSEISKVDEWLSEGMQQSVPRMILVAVQELARESLERAEEEVYKIANATTLTDRLTDLRLQVDGLSGRGSRKAAAKTSQSGLEEPMVAAIKAILSHSKSASKGITLSSDVLRAFEAALY